MMYFLGLLLLELMVISSSTHRYLPKNLKFGTSTSSYQIEGAWNEDGKTENIWDYMLHSHPNLVKDGSNGDIACDAYHKVKEDVGLIKSVGFQQYRFSLSWSRILPFGFSNVVNKKGIQYYNDLINELIANDITPIVTIYHWDLPQSLQDLGGWTNSLIADWFENYARVVYENFGDRVKLWITINEPKAICRTGYGVGYFAPGIKSEGIAEYLCARNILMAHARAYHLYNNRFRSKQNGRVSITVECSWMEAGSNSILDQEAADRALQFEFGLYTHAIYSEAGDFPRSIKQSVAIRSLAEGYPNSRLPVLSQKEIDYIRGTYDFFGLNYYTTLLVRNKVFPIGLPSTEKDSGVEYYIDPRWPVGKADYFRSVPWGFRNVLSYIKHNYGDPDILVTESGFPDFNEFNDTLTIRHHMSHLDAMMDAIEVDKVKVQTYSVWSLVDNFEWMDGYFLRFGIYHVNFEDSERTRTPKLSYKFFKDLIKTKKLHSKLSSDMYNAHS